MTKAKELKALVSELSVIRESHKNRLNEIKANSDYTDLYKNRECKKTTEEAKTQLADIREKIKKILPEIESLTVKQKKFDYNNNDLLSAMKFIQMSGKNLPKSAWKQMIENHSDNPSELFFLADLFERNGVIEGAIEAKEKANNIYVSIELPQRVSDMAYYVAEADITAHIDIDKFNSELDILDNYENNINETTEK